MAILLQKFALALAVAVLDGLLLGLLTQSKEVGLIVGGLCGAATLVILNIRIRFY